MIEWRTLSRMNAKTRVTPTGCWEWTGSRQRNGYGRVSFQGQSRFSHRVGYTLLVGPIPEGMQIDHLCRNRACWNPDHLEVVTCRVNLLRGETLPAACAAKTACPRSHLYDAENTWVDNRGARICRTCNKTRCKTYRRAA